MRPISTCVLVWLLTVLSAHALLSPDWMLQRGRAARALNEPQRKLAQDLAARTDVAADVKTYEASLESGRGEAPALAFRFYAAVAMAERRERILQAFDERVELLEAAREPLEEYVARCQSALHVASGSVPRVALPGPRREFPDLDVDNQGLTVYRKLLWPEGKNRADVAELLKMGQEDLQFVIDGRERALVAREDYRLQQKAWYAWLQQMSTLLERLSDSQLKAGKIGANP